ncbi:hypothetical protein EDM54_01465 [Brevibacillus borstelensis]|uniref:ImmA/IrrE family metallo-endopeptidase n=1 Tax=Brevibacillus borstelensis TaxID=45462 RepID=UPI00057C09AB|nr:ImmA/IrrE family metallo-endopeptidase [Brevibacillus borstelensis]MED1881101.1 hypothetical protein [Brevibacillus borstelensis]RNB66370.1 hypothetical protein EDM54_01465 [Brevibacillus borstelensis]
MDLSFYKTSEVEEWLYDLYKANGIYHACDLDIDHIASIFNAVIVESKNCRSQVIFDDEFCMILLGEHLDNKTRREHFFHELCHPLMHVGNQNHLPRGLVDLQEIQAAQFQLYSSIPVYMIEELVEEVNTWSQFEHLLSEEFQLPLHLVKKRLEQIKNRVYDGFISGGWSHRTLSKPIFQYDWRFRYFYQ